jgi:hypothetical protein
MDFINSHTFNGWSMVFGVMAVLNLGRGHLFSAILLGAAAFEFGIRPLINT